MDMIYEWIPEFHELDFYVQGLFEQEHKSMREWIWEMITSGDILNQELIFQKIQLLLLNEWTQIKEIFVTTLLLFFISAFLQIVMEALHNRGVTLMTRYVLLFLELCFLTRVWMQTVEIAHSDITSMLTFMKLAIPAFMTSVALTGKEITSVMFKKILMECVCGIEGVGITICFGVVKLYVIMAILEVIYDEGKFISMLQLLKKGIHLFMKGCFFLLSIGNVLQLMIMPSIDHTNQEILQKTVSGIPGIGDISESISSITLASMVTIKNGLGVGILLLLFSLLLPGFMKVGSILLALRTGAAIGSIVGDSCLNKGISYFTEAGYMVLKVMIMLATLFFVSIALFMI